ncbi:MAG: IS110 family transposase [Bacteroidota bacterium]|nr:IS110 family transposase [Bacteroidota bacterium]
MKKEIHYQQVIEVGCGLDVHKETIVATIRSSSRNYETKEFSSFTSSLTELSDWCKQQGVTHIAMESTGVYWKPVYNVLEDEAFEIILVNARHVKNIPGHKTDKKDSAWLSKLLLSGLLKGSFIPPVDIRELRDLVRYKKKKTQVVAAEKNRMIKILEDCNIKLSSVVSDVQGVSATKMVNAITRGETDVKKLAAFAHGKIQADTATIKKALEGKVTDHHRFMLQIARESIEVNEALITKLDGQIEKASEKYKVELDLLQTIDGVGKDSAIAIISEIGADMKQFPNEHHLASWSGMSPGNNESGGKKKAQEQSKETNTYNQP